MKIAKKILYIGSDQNYWMTVQNRFKSMYEHMELEFVTLAHSDLVNPKLLEIMDLAPSFIYIDLSKDLKNADDLALNLKRIRAFSHIPVIGLVDEVSKVDPALFVGYDLIYIKDAETHDVVYHPFTMAFPNEALKKDFALAKFSENSTIMEPLRIGYFGETSMHIESNFDFSIDDVIKLKNNIDKEMIPSQLFKIKEKSERDLYYDFKYSYEVEYEILPAPQPDQEEINDCMMIEDEKEREKAIKIAQGRILEQKTDFEHKLKKLKKQINDWVKYNTESKQAKKTKIMIVDETLSFLGNEKRKLDSFPYTLRVQTSFNETFSQIDQYLPQIVVYSIPGPELDEGIELSEDEMAVINQEHNTYVSEFISSLISKIGSIQNYSPFLVIFNAGKLTSKSFQDTYKYQLVLTNPGSIDLDIVLKMAELYEKKQDDLFEKNIQEKIANLRSKDPQKYGRLNRADFVEPKYFISKSKDLSKAWYEYPIEVKAISESEIFFLFDKELSLGNFVIETPFKMAIRLVPQEGAPYVKQDNKLMYKGLIHSVDETLKKEIRKYVNDIYTAHKTEEREKEEEEFKALNEARVKELEDAENEKAAKEAQESQESEE